MPHTFSTSEQLTYSTVQVICECADGSTSVGTAFHFSFCKRGTISTPCLVTNKHVVEGAVTGILRFHVSDDKGDSKRGHTYEFRVADFAAACFAHPNPEIDLTIFPIGGIIEQMTKDGRPPFIIGLGVEDLPSDSELAELEALEDVTMVGYPIGLSDQLHNLPLFRRGATATHPAIDYNGNPEFLIDAASFPGSSGSPVFLYNVGSYPARNGKLVPKSRVKLLGILYAGPVYSATGTVETVPIPTSQVTIFRAQIPMHLGMVLKSRLLLEFEPLILHELSKGKSVSS